jgi:peptidoglycan/xylan/chitin deacetylase (PgdA/CDA1 family)
MKGVFTISLDFELHWGGFEKWPLEDYRTYFLNTRAVIPQMLALFAEHKVHVTWATVGILLTQGRSQLVKEMPASKPSYRVKELSAYHYIDQQGVGEDETTDPFHFAPSLIRQILDTPHQELGSHTFAHYYCNEEGQTLAQFRADLQAAQRVARGYGKTLRSLVFPRNQFNESYLKVCYDEGFIAVRDNPHDWFWNIGSTADESLWKRLNRGADAYLPIGHKNTYPLASITVREQSPLCLPASRLLRPYRPKELFLNTMKIRRICQEMERAARNHEVYHLWWHPHNFGHYPQESINGLRTILKHYQYCQQRYDMESMTMGETAVRILQGHEKTQVA